MAITPDKAAIEAAGLEFVEPHEIVADTGPKALNLLAQAVVDIQAKPATIPGDIPIFATLAEAEAFEAANPGRPALYLDGPIVVTPGDLMVADDFDAPDMFLVDLATETQSQRSTPMGALPWEKATLDEINASYTPSIVDNTFRHGAGRVTLPTNNVTIDADFQADAGTATKFALGGIVFVAQTSNSTYRLFEANGSNLGKVLITNSGEPWAAGPHHLTMKYDGATLTVALDGKQIISRTQTINSSVLALATDGASYGSGGNLQRVEDAWIDNLEVRLNG